MILHFIKHTVRCLMSVQFIPGYIKLGATIAIILTINSKAKEQFYSWND